MTADLDRHLAALPDPARNRLERFAAEFERLGAGQYVLFATVAEDDARTDRAFEAARVSRGSPARRAAARAAAAAFVDWVVQGYTSRLSLPDTILLFQSLPDRPQDRIRLARSVQAAVIGLVAWETAAGEDVGVLVGPFLEMAERAAGEVPGGDG
ncbi:MAG: hypothetical protein AB1736_00855 [Chloroflexota bacterium]